MISHRGWHGETNASLPSPLITVSRKGAPQNDDQFKRNLSPDSKKNFGLALATHSDNVTVL
jgi:hypothetical protein